jgi:hypothetical protein
MLGYILEDLRRPFFQIQKIVPKCTKLFLFQQKMGFDLQRPSANFPPASPPHRFPPGVDCMKCFRQKFPQKTYFVEFVLMTFYTLGPGRA